MGNPGCDTSIVFPINGNCPRIPKNFADLSNNTSVRAVAAVSYAFRCLFFTCGCRGSQEIPCGQCDPFDTEALFPSSLVVEVSGNTKLVVLILDHEESVVLKVSEFDLTPAHHGVSPVTVVIVVQTTVVDHGRQIGMLMLKGTNAIFEQSARRF